MRLSVDRKSVKTLREFSDIIKQNMDSVECELAELKKMLIKMEEELGPHYSVYLKGILEIERRVVISVDKSGYLSSELNEIADQMEQFINSTASINFAYGESNENHYVNSSSSVNDSEYHIKVSIDNKYLEVCNLLDRKRVVYRKIEKNVNELSEEEIIKNLGGGDRTCGSCSSLAFAYIGNKAGYKVLDFRDGASRDFFSQNSSINLLTRLNGVQSNIIYGRNDVDCAEKLLSTMLPDKEYYFATGLHASIIRMHEGQYQYLELQSTYDNGWKLLDKDMLDKRFGCGINIVKQPNFLIDIESLMKSGEFLDILGYINTAEEEQHKGAAGYVR